VKLSFDPKLKPGDTINNQELGDIFKCSSQGGMRRALRTNTLVIVSDQTKAIYEDRWIKDILHYTGMGLEGDQNINYSQNKTLAQIHSNNVEPFLFEVFLEGQYIYRGKIDLAAEPYQEEQPDIKGNIRQTWIFPLKLVDEKSSIPLPEHVILKKQKKKQRDAKRLSIDILEERAKYSKKGVGSRQVTSTTFERNEYVAELAKRRAKGFCQLCEEPAPFKNKKGEPFLESHHIVWLSKGGDDTIENTVALCPNCHRKMHSLNLKSDINHLEEKSGIKLDK
jgi:5-methylcytosine-specific restriction protein A